jgi:hypothetical protein
VLEEAKEITMYLDSTMMLGTARQEIADKIKRSQRQAQRREARAVLSPSDAVARRRRTWSAVLAGRSAA